MSSSYVLSNTDAPLGETKSLRPLPRILLVDDHHLLLEALTFVLVPHYEVLCISSLSKLDSAIASFDPHVLVVDISMPDGDGIAIGQQLTRRHPQIKLIFLSMHTDPNQIRRATEAGAHGYVCKRGPADELLKAIETTLNGGRFQSALPGTINQQSQVNSLTERQMQVLRLVARGFSAKEIATDLNISVRTAEFHRGAIMQRLNMHSTALLTRYAVANGFV